MPALQKNGNRRSHSPKALKPVPVFKSLEEEANFWDTHDTTEYDLEGLDETIGLAGALRVRVEKRRIERLAALLELALKQVQATRNVKA